MKTYIILTRLSQDTFTDPKELREVAVQVSERIKRDCPQVKWKESFATLGRFDVVDIVEADDEKEVERAAMIIRGIGRSVTETLVATPWKEFLENL